MRCPVCAELDDKVVDSRANDDGSASGAAVSAWPAGTASPPSSAARRSPLVVVKRSGDRAPFDRAKVEAGVRAAAKGRPIDDEQVPSLAGAVEDELRLVGGRGRRASRSGWPCSSGSRELDEVAYLRFASVYKGFDDAADFQRELRLLTKATEPKRH